MPVIFNSSSLSPTLRGMASVDRYGIPRFWATIWIDVLQPTLEPSTRRKHLTALDRLYEASNRQRGRDCLDHLIAEADANGLEDVLLGFLAQLRNEAVITGFDKTSTWTSAVSFVIDMLRYTGNSSGARAAEMEAKLLRLDVLYRQLAPNPDSTEGPVIRALPSTVVQDLYEIFRPDSARNPFKTETLRWRNLVIFMLLLRLGLRRGEAALLYVDFLQGRLQLRHRRNGSLARRRGDARRRPTLRATEPENCAVTAATPAIQGACRADPDLFAKLPGQSTLSPSSDLPEIETFVASINERDF